jgi:hypothetical protein
MQLGHITSASLFLLSGLQAVYSNGRAVKAQKQMPVAQKYLEAMAERIGR